MNGQPIRPAFAHLLPAEHFQAWRVLGNGTSDPLDVSRATTPTEAIDLAAQHCSHKDWFTVLQHTAPGKTVEHVCYVKQGKARFVRKPGFAHAVQIKPLEAEVQFSRAVVSCQPVERFRAVPGADVVGIDRSVVEARNA